LADSSHQKALRCQAVFVIILRVLHDTQANLLEIGHATGAARVFTGTSKHREQNGGEDCYDGYDDK
jgi:hypothetical protein